MALSYESDADARILSEIVFQKLDTDGGGNLSTDELLKARDFMCRKFGEDACSALDSSDVNGDGVIDMEEWHAFCEGVYEMLGKREFVEDLQVWIESFSEPASPTSRPGTATTRGSPKTPGSTKSNKSGKGHGAKAKKHATGGVECAETAAATKIQAIHRGKKARQEVDSKKAKETKPKKVVTVADLWEWLSMSGGQIRTTVPVGDVILMYADACRAGLDVALATTLPMTSFEVEVEPVDLSVEQVAHLCTLLLANADLDEDTARQSLKDNAPFGADRERREYAMMDGLFNLKRLKRLVSLLSSLMRIDEEYVVLQMQFVTLGVFEMTDTMAALIIERGTVMNDSPAGKKRASVRSFDSEVPNESVLSKKFNLDAFQRLLYNVGIVDSSGKMGIIPGDISLIHQRAIKNMSKRLEERAVKKKAKVTKGTSKHANDKDIVGRTEFEILLEELNDIPSIQRLFPSPMIMAIQFARKAKEAAQAHQAAP